MSNLLISTCVIAITSYMVSNAHFTVAQQNNSIIAAVIVGIVAYFTLKQYTKENYADTYPLICKQDSDCPKLLPTCYPGGCCRL